MKGSPKNRKSSNGAVEGQLSAAFVLQGLEQKAQEQMAVYSAVQLSAVQSSQNAQNAFNAAVDEIEKIRDFVSPGNLAHVLGRESTKHGEIAEQVEVGVTNAFQVIKGLPKVANVESVPRTGPVDYDIHGTPIQSKFYNGSKNTLEHGVLEHLEKYPKFTTDASLYGYPDKAGFYHVPKDQYEQLLSVKNGGSIAGMKDSTVEGLRKSIQELEQKTGKDFSEVVKPSLSNYDDVKIHNIGKTLDDHEESLKRINREQLDSIEEKRKADMVKADHVTDASWAEAAKASAVSAAIMGVTSAGIRVYSKIKEGKKIGSFTLEDWKDVGIDFAKGAGKGGITGAGIYGLTKLGGYPAPFAGAMVSGPVGLASLAIDYKNGKINRSDFADAACALSVETGLTAVGTAIGQALIPIPVLGGIIGTAVTKSALEITKYIMGNQEKELIAKMERDYMTLCKKLDAEEAALLKQINDYYDKLGGLIAGSMNLDVNIRLKNSIELARYVKVPEKEIIHNNRELDDFMLG